MAKEKTMSQKLRELADWLDAYEKWYKQWKENNEKDGDVETDEGGQPGGPPPPPPGGGH